MFSRTTSGLALAALLVLPALSRAEEPRGRARTWDIEANAGMSYLDGGFDDKLLGYRLDLPPGGTGKVPPTDPDNLTPEIPTLGVRFGYNFTRYFTLEVGGAFGETDVGDGTEIILEENFTAPGGPDQRKTILAQQTATAPGILAAYETLDFDYTTGNMMGVFKFNNRTTSRWVFYGSLGGGYFSLNPDTTAYNECNPTVVVDPTIDPYNGDPNDPFTPDLFQDNPNQEKVVPGCGRAFLTATATGNELDPLTGEQVRVTHLGSLYQDAVPVTEDTPPNIFIDCPPGQVLTEDLDTGQFFCDGEAQWVNPPGQLATAGFSTTGQVRSIQEWFYSVGGGVRWHFKPRQVLRIDVKRHFIENINKNINEVTVGWNFILGRGKPDIEAGVAPPPMEPVENDAVPPPTDLVGEPLDDDAVPPPLEPAEDDGSGLS